MPYVPPRPRRPQKRTGRTVDRSSLVGLRFGLLTVLAREPALTSHRETRWLVVCECGQRKVMYRGSLVRGLSKSCGCQRPVVRRRVRPGPSRHTHPEHYWAWRNMKSRVQGKTGDLYQTTTIWGPWFRFPQFVRDLGPRPEGHVFHRVDASLPFEPGNAGWHPRQGIKKPRKARVAR